MGHVLGGGAAWARLGVVVALASFASGQTGCTHPTAGGGSDGPNAATDARADSDATNQGWPPAGALLSCLWIELPCPIETINLIDPCDYASLDVPPLLVRAGQAQSGLLIRGGSCRPDPDVAGSCLFVDQLTPVQVAAVTGAAIVTDAGVRTPFETTTPFSWPLTIIPQQAPLEVTNASMTGTLDADQVPTSDLPPMAGTLTGCLTRASTEAIYLEILGMTLEQLLVGCGATPGCDSTGGGGLDGYVLTAHWSGQRVAIEE